jgi:uncharacterized protein (TIGR02246 family)
MSLAISRDGVMGDVVEETRIREVWARLSEAWSSADPRGVAAAWDVDSDHRRVGAPPRPECRGRDELERSLAAAFFRRRQSGERSLSCRIGSIRFVRPDVAIVDGVLYVTAPGTSKPMLTEPLTAVMAKRGDDWFIAASRVGAPQAVNGRR